MTHCVGLATLRRVPRVGPTTLCRKLLCTALLLHVVAQVSFGCPEKCRCRENTHSVIAVQCNNASLTDLPSGKDFQDALFIDLSFNNITTLKSFALLDREMTTVEILDLQYNRIKTIGMQAFRGLKELRLLDLGYNDITQISRTVFNTNTKLNLLKLSGNKNLQLPEAGFHLMDLEIIFLHRCGLKSIPPEFFHSLPNLKYIYLSNNQLTSFDSRLVSPLTLLRRLDLRKNEFASLLSNLFRLSPESLNIEFSKNPLECKCAMFDAYVIYHSRRFQEILICKKPARVPLWDFFNSTCNKTLPSPSESTTSSNTTPTTNYITEGDDDSKTTLTAVEEDVTTTGHTLETTTERSSLCPTPSWQPWWVVLCVGLALVVLAGITCVTFKRRRKSREYTL